jgi:predicted SAM-dependent methyltransferase
MLDETQPNACGYLRLFLPLTKKIVSDCFDVRFVKLEDLPYLKADVVITQRTAVKTLAKVQQLVSYCKETGTCLIFDLDDELLSLPDHHPEREIFEAHKHIGLRLIAEADELWASTPSIADRFIGIARDIAVMPNQLDDRIWTAPAENAPDSRRPVRFLYMGTPTHRPDFDELIKPAFSELKAEFGKKIELDLIGVVNEPDPGDCWRIVTRPAEVGNSYPAFATWLQSLPRYDVGLAPLLDVVFNRCKSDVKWLEYSAIGLATVAANLPAYNQSIEQERTGLLADADADSFKGAMRRLIVDVELRRSLQMHACQLTAENLHLAPLKEPRLERLRELTRQPRSVGIHATASRPVAASNVLLGRIDRKVLSHAFVHGRGIEIGALQRRLPVAANAQVTYVDRMSKADLYEHYPELRAHDLVDVDVIDDGETLSNFQGNSQDFIIANHFFEHCQDPIKTIKNFLRVLRPEGIIYMALPDMRHTFDRDRARTEIAHLIDDHAWGPAISRKHHFREWVTLVEPHFGRVYVGEDVIEARVHDLMTQNYSIHFHAFKPEDMRALIDHCAEVECMPISIVFSGEFGEEMIFILRKANAEVTGERQPRHKSTIRPTIYTEMVG